jgi:AraC-like DNA-binding protein/quercetin dioxygenase-like cupin family protein
MLLGTTAEVLWTARYDYDPGWELRPHTHQFFQAVYLIDGEGTVTLAGRSYPIEPSHILVAAPGVRHGLRAASRVRTLDIKFRVRDHELARLLLRTTPVYRAADSNYRVLFERIWQEGYRKEPLHRQMCAVYLVELLLLLVRTNGSPEPVTTLPVTVADAVWTHTDAVTAAAAKFANAHLTEPLTIRRVAGELGCPERSLRQRFREVLGISPFQYLTRLRIDKAKSLIRDLDCPLKEAALDVGFRNVHHFTRVFHRITGMSPGAWREVYVNGIRTDINVKPEFHNVSLIANRGTPFDSAATPPASSHVWARRASPRNAARHPRPA